MPSCGSGGSSTDQMPTAPVPVISSVSLRPSRPGRLKVPLLHLPPVRGLQPKCRRQAPSKAEMGKGPRAFLTGRRAEEEEVQVAGVACRRRRRPSVDLEGGRWWQWRADASLGALRRGRGQGQAVGGSKGGQERLTVLQEWPGRVLTLYVMMWVRPRQPQPGAYHLTALLSTPAPHVLGPH